MKRLQRLLLGTAIALALPATSQAAHPHHVKHVLLISIDGLHALDLENYIAAHKNSALAQLARSGVRYPNALTTAPSDSFPGMLAQVTGGTPYSTGVFYDDSFDRALYAPGSNCQGAPGTETQFAENIDKDQDRLDAGGTLGKPLTQIDPAKLPLALVNGHCEKVYPHQFNRVNTVFEVIREHGGRTAWSDKHPAYDILNGPTGKGIEDLFTPEINSQFPGSNGADNTGSFTATQRYDEVKVHAVLNEINGLDSTGDKFVGVPAIFGMNFQAVSVGQKLAKAGPTDPANLVGGYADPDGTPNSGLQSALDYVDGALDEMVDALKAKHLDQETLIIISAKHGQSPIDLSKRVALDDGPYANTPGYGFHIADDVALIWLDPSKRGADLTAAQSYLESQFGTLGIAELLTRDNLKLLYQDPAKDSRTPDFIAIVNQGVIYTGGTKLAEHGGFALDDRNVALLVSQPGLPARKIQTTVTTTQIAPTILKALGLDPKSLQAVRKEGTEELPELYE